MTIIIKDKILRSDLAHWDGLTSTRTRRDSTGGTVTGLKVGTEVDVLQVYGGGVNYDDHTIQRCIDSIGSRSVTLVFQPGTWEINANVTVGSNFTCRVPNGCVFSPASGKTLTFNGPVIRDGQTWTGGSGTVTEGGTRYLSGKLDLTNAVLQGGTPLVFEGASDDAFETRFIITDPTADRTVTFPDANVDLTNVLTSAGSYTITGLFNFAGNVTISGTFTYTPAGVIFPYAGSSAPTGFLLCDGSAVSRTTYANLFAAISTTFGTGDGSTTFNVPDMRGRSPVGAGTGTLTASGVNADVDTGNDTLTVTSNNTTWITGMSVVFTLSSGTITGLTSGNTYYVIRNNSTTVKLASSLANAVAGTAIDMTAKSSPVWTLTHTLTARTLGEKLGEESHASTIAETAVHTHVQDAHSHVQQYDGTDGGGGATFTLPATVMDTNENNVNNTEMGNTTSTTVATNQNTGSSNAHNNMHPGLGLNYIIKT